MYALHITVKSPMGLWVNSLWPSYVIGRQGSRSTLAQVMACWQVVAWWHQAITWTNFDLPSVRSIGIHLSTILQEMLQPSITKISWKITFLKISLNYSRGQWVKQEQYLWLEVNKGKCQLTHLGKMLPLNYQFITKSVFLFFMKNEVSKYHNHM